MERIQWKGSTLLGPVPPALVTCANGTQTNVLTVGWTGIVNTHPAMTYVSIRPSRFSYHIIKESGEFVINLPKSSMARETDLCGMKTGENYDKIKACHFHLTPFPEMNTPLIEECPISLGCRIVQEISLPSHTMFLAEIIGVSVQAQYVDSKGKLNLQQAGLLAYLHGEYFSIGRKQGDFGFSVRKKKKPAKKIVRNDKDKAKG